MIIGFAHRGARKEHPDNTLAGFERALQLGANGLESDLWVTADGHGVLDHDGVVRIRWRTQPISSLRREELPSHIPTIREFFELPGVSEVDVSLDVKDPEAARVVLGLNGVDFRRLWLCGTDLAHLRSWHDQARDVRPVLSVGLARLGSDPVGFFEAAKDFGVEAVNLREREWSPQLINACHQAGLRAFGWDAQSASKVTRLAASGIDAVYSDDVAMMVRVLSEHRDA